MILSKRKQEARRAYAESLAKPVPSSRTMIAAEPSGPLRQALGYEHSVPRCETCRHVKKSMTIIHKHTTRLPVVLVPPVCQRGKFQTRETALCDHWTGRDGSVLAAEAH